IKGSLPLIIGGCGRGSRGFVHRVSSRTRSPMSRFWKPIAGSLATQPGTDFFAWLCAFARNLVLTECEKIQRRARNQQNYLELCLAEPTSQRSQKRRLDGRGPFAPFARVRRVAQTRGARTDWLAVRRRFARGRHRATPRSQRFRRERAIVW